MSQEQVVFIEDEIPLREYILVPLRKWWVVVSVLGFTLAAAWVFVLQQPEVYQARTKLLIVAPVSEQLLGHETNAQDNESLNPLVGRNLSVETLSALATANDLIQKIIVELDLRDSSTGRHWGVERLAGMMNPEVQTAGQGGALSLLTMTVKGGDPRLLERAANKWAEIFIEENSQLLVAEAASSFEFVSTQYQETQKALYAKQEEKLAYQRGHQLAPLVGQLNVSEATFQEFLGQLQSKRAALVRGQAQLQSAEEAFAGETRLQTFERSISTDAIWGLLASNPDSEVVQALPQLKVTDQEPNELYFSLKNRIVSLRSSVATLTAEIDYLEGKIEELTGSIEELSNSANTIRLELFRLDEDIRVLTDDRSQLSRNFQAARIAKAGELGSIRVVESAVEPRVADGPDRRRHLLFGAVLGLLLGVALAFFLHYLQGGASNHDRPTHPEAVG